ncbi:lipoprotein [Spiroplasma eriocheiris]|uniref:Lipoprotein n=1 Tax=Spiroplasma eriocheiris TaxID=315358 RepID=A0A0H3XIY8_9MOLU|nr:lipoprotein [Spiroplasma eriocheiris]AHF58061.1 hypothetical protein SPE_0941 [Spiroplasma eriocheiris CCTCC M 207170]AKM54500.1 hypothetical protein SERIO_v1c09420 [Spiroplasma eriocheiris]
MRKLLGILGVVTLVGSSTVSVVACHKTNNGKTNVSYFDHELDQIANKTNEELVKN